MASAEQLANSDIDEQIQALTDAVMSGKCSDYASYKESCGKYRGLEVARNLFNDRLQGDEDE